MLNKWQTTMVIALLSVNVSLSECAMAQNTQANKAPKSSKYSLSGPFKSGNLAVYLIHGKDAAPNLKLITLGEALAQKKVVVHETGSVNQLSVENKGDVAVFLQSGDIVKGGQQDRTLQYDMVLQPKSGKVPVDSFCVEHGRWTQRGAESRAQFNGSNNMLASKGLKLAAKSSHGSANQGQVWDEVSKYQTKMAAKARPLAGGGGIMAAPSPSSLQLTLESDGVKKLSDNYVRDLKPVTTGKTDTVGYAFCVNGKINSIDVYPTHDLFARLWPKLMVASAQEAAAEKEEGKTFAPPPVAEVQKYIEDNESAGTESKQTVGGRLIVVRRESKKNLYMETQNQVAGKTLWYHKNYLAK